MVKKVLIGVYHNQENIERTIQAIHNYNPSSVGLEIPEDYEQKEICNIGFFFFDDIINALRKQSVKIIPLEDSRLRDYFNVVDLTKNIMEGNVNQNEVQEELSFLEKINYNYMPPEQSLLPLLLRSRYKQALKLMNTYNLKEVISLWNDSNYQRELQMKKNIHGYNPDVNVIGEGHTRLLIKDLPEYEYIVVK